MGKMVQWWSDSPFLIGCNQVNSTWVGYYGQYKDGEAMKWIMTHIKATFKTRIPKMTWKKGDVLRPNVYCPIKNFWI